MKTEPCNILRLAFALLLALVLCSASLPTTAQQRGRNRAKPIAKTQAQDAERARRAKALTLLIETADDARAIDDLLYRARLQAMAADALWPFDQQRARATFRRAWEAAATSDKAAQELNAQVANEPLESIEPVTEARDEVLAKAAARDSSLAEIFLRDLQKIEEGETNEDQRGERRLDLGFELLDKGEVESAFKIVAPLIGEGANFSLLIFMLRLSEREAATGEAFYRLMIAQLSRDTAADANTVLLLSMPIISPELMASVDEFGSLRFRRFERDKPLPPVSPATRIMFLNAAASVLLRPASHSTGATEAQETASRYYAIGRLRPFFESEAAQFVPELQVRMNALLSELTESRRASLSSQLNLRTLGARPSTDPLQYSFDELTRASEQSRRERLLTRIVHLAVKKRFWDRARRAAAELSDENMRRATNTFIAINQIADLSRAYADEKEDDYESIISFLKSVDVPPLAAAWGYAQAAQVAARRRDPQRVAELLTEATQYAERVDANTSQRVAAYGIVAQHATRLDRQRAWELMTEVVKAANALEDYAGDEAAIEIKTDENAAADTESPFTVTLDVFRLDTIFATMAQLDFDRALSNARSLDGRVPRVFAQLAIARATLEKK